ncbi:MAG: DUF5915 domain-containing protein, partial [Clostridiales bacterium]|nr:DUF5915 domain-containing protein [Clostridiales bacterium]
LPNRFHGDAVVEGQRKFMGTLWNTYAFFVLYANIDNFDATKYELEYDKLPAMDRWMLSKLNSLIQNVDRSLENYQIPEAARFLQNFVDDMSNWYVRRSRERFWAKGMEQDKINAYMTLYTTLVTVSKLAAPLVPFITEDMYQNLVRSLDENAPESIHLCDYPAANQEWIDKELEQDMDAVRKLVAMGRACRNTANIKNRQPIGQMFIKDPVSLNEFYGDIIKEELNVKNVKFTDEVSDFTSYNFKPQMKTLGPKYGKKLGEIRTILAEINGNAAMNELKTTGELKLTFADGTKAVLTEEDLLIETAQAEGYVSEVNGEWTVVLDTNLTPELLDEGLLREVVSKIQTMRKEAGFEVMDHILVSVAGNDKVAALISSHQDEVLGDVMADSLLTNEVIGYNKEWKLNGEMVTLGVKKVEA